MDPGGKGSGKGRKKGSFGNSSSSWSVCAADETTLEASAVRNTYRCVPHKGREDLIFCGCGCDYAEVCPQVQNCSRVLRLHSTQMRTVWVLRRKTTRSISRRFGLTVSVQANMRGWATEQRRRPAESNTSPIRCSPVPGRLPLRHLKAGPGGAEAEKSTAASASPVPSASADPVGVRVYLCAA